MKSEVRISKHGALNAFQSTMFLWNELHPYNAVHAVLIPEPLDLRRLKTVIDATLETQGLTALTLDLSRGKYRYAGGPSDCNLSAIVGEDSARAALYAEIERQLNTAFVFDQPFAPFRFFAVPQTDSFFLGNAYFHPIADAVSVVRLMKNLVDAYARKGEPKPSPPLGLYPPRHDTLLCQPPALLGRKLLALPGLVRNMRESCRPPFRDVNDLSNRFTFFSLERKQLLSLVRTGKSWDVTLNDLLLALLMKSLAPLASSRFRATRRRKISVGCIVNLRNDLATENQRDFGLFLGSFAITHEVPDAISLRDLARNISENTKRIKRAKLYSGMPLELALGRFLLQLFSTERRKKLYQKHYPLWGGITNMNLKTLWQQEKEATCPDYLRAVSTGPVTPLVLSVTTAGYLVNVAVSYRSTVFSAWEIEQVRGRILDSIQHTEN